MAKDPAFLFYPGDWLGGTIGMTFEEKGAYMELLMMQFNRGHMTSHMIGQVVGHLWDKIQVKFVQDKDGLWYNERLDVEKEKRKNFVSTRKNNLSGNNQHTKNKKNTKHMKGHMTSHMENENRNVNGYIKDSYKDAEEFWKEVKKDELFIERLQRMVISNGFRACTPDNILTAVYKFIAKESAKPGFTDIPRQELKNYLVNWINKLPTDQMK
jgi:uncharacterized protein YdaU (DUF1376 family)